MAFVEVLRSESYRMRSSATYKGDTVEGRTLRIGDKRFESARIFWADGTVTVSVTPYGQTTQLHFWEGRPDPLPCGHVPSYGCDCAMIAAEAASGDDPWESALMNVTVPMPTGLSAERMVYRHVQTCASQGRDCVVCESV